MNLVSLLLKHGPAAFGFLRRHGPLILELGEAIAPVLRKMVEQDVPHAGTALAVLDQISEIVVGLGQPEASTSRPETAGG